MTSDNNMPTPRGRFGDPVVLVLTIGFIVAFVLLSAISPGAVTDAIGAGFTWTAGTFGSFFQLLLLLTFVVVVALFA